uniref:Glycylpeptide N-tetradecanoyltransferase n=1 Tax=viral metagenome TaxID=1070528 RepID=A0A6C0JGB3_9ZZZZ
MIEYILLGLTLIYIIFYAYIKISYPFWNNQPVFHTYDYWRFLYQNPFFIYKYRPMKTKFCEFNQIKTISFLDTTPQQRKEICYFLQANYIQNDRILLTSLEKDLEASFTGQNESSYISIYNEKKLEFSKIDASNGFTSQYDDIVSTLKPIGYVLSRHVKFYFKQYVSDNTYSELPIYYIDIICVKRELDHKKINRQLLQTHEFNQREKNPTVICSLIKKEIDLFQGVIPLVEYPTYVFHLRNIKFPPLPTHFHTTYIDLEHISILTDFLYVQTHLDLAKSSKHFDIMAISDMGNLIALIKQGLLHPYCLRNGEHVYGFYFIKDAKMQYEDIEGDTLQCVGSIMNCDSASIFYQGFLHSLHDLIKKKTVKYQMLMFEQISDNTILLDFWLDKHTPVFTNKTAYYTFNLIFPQSPINPGRCFVL